MTKVKLYSNYVKISNATVFDNETEVEEIVSIVRQALESGVKEIYFNYKEEGLDERDTPLKIIKTDTCSQACPKCRSAVNWGYCSNCGQKLKY